MTGLALTLGVEEEYLLIDRETLDLAIEPPLSLMDDLKAELGDNVTGELYRCQIEVMTPVCADVEHVSREVRRLRRGVADVSARYGLAPLAVSAHPFAPARGQVQVRNARYDRLVAELGSIIERYLICGVHVHLAVLDDDLRISVLQALRPFLPFFLAFTTSSPFWEGQDTQVKSYRLAVCHSLPRSGMPDNFSDHADYQRFVTMLIEAGLVEDATVLWWDVRPSAKFPTLELRVCDACTSVEDTLSITAFYQALVSYLVRTGEVESARGIPMPVIRENLWRAQRYGLDGGFLDYRSGRLLSGREMTKCLLDMVGEDAGRLNNRPWLARLETLPERGTSADRQRGVYRQAVEAGAAHMEAMRAVVRHVMAETVAGC